MQVTVVAGTWNIRVEAYYKEELYAVGYTTVEVKARQNTNVSIQMNVIVSDDSGSGISGGGGGGGGGGVGGGSVVAGSGDASIAIALSFAGGTDPAKGFNDKLPSTFNLSYELNLINDETPSLKEPIAVNPTTGKTTKLVDPGSYSIEVTAKVNG